MKNIEEHFIKNNTPICERVRFLLNAMYSPKELIDATLKTPSRYLETIYPQLLKQYIEGEWKSE